MKRSTTKTRARKKKGSTEGTRSSGWKLAATKIPLPEIAGRAVRQIEPNYDDTSEEIGENDPRVEG
jgi:hypothetical protein